MTWEQILPLLGQGVIDTLVVTLVSTLISYLIGAPIGVILYGTAKGSLFPNKPVNAVLGVIVLAIGIYERFSGTLLTFVR